MRGREDERWWRGRGVSSVVEGITLRSADRPPCPCGTHTRSHDDDKESRRCAPAQGEQALAIQLNDSSSILLIMIAQANDCKPGMQQKQRCWCAGHASEGESGRESLSRSAGRWRRALTDTHTHEGSPQKESRLSPSPPQHHRRRVKHPLRDDWRKEEICCAKATKNMRTSLPICSGSIIIRRH